MLLGSCSFPRAIDCGIHGRCIDGACTCYDGWTGTLCASAPPQPDRCESECAKDVDCIRDIIFETLTDVVTDPVHIDCGQYGSCTDGVCVCTDGYTGEHCRTVPPTCYWSYPDCEQPGKSHARSYCTSRVSTLAIS